MIDEKLSLLLGKILHEIDNRIFNIHKEMRKPKVLVLNERCYAALCLYANTFNKTDKEWLKPETYRGIPIVLEQEAVICLETEDGDE